MFGLDFGTSIAENTRAVRSGALNEFTWLHSGFQPAMHARGG
jgi:hypothetical protein